MLRESGREQRIGGRTWREKRAEKRGARGRQVGESGGRNDYFCGDRRGGCERDAGQRSGQFAG